MSEEADHNRESAEIEVTLPPLSATDAAEQVLQRSRQLVQWLTGNWDRMLWRRVIVVSGEGADPLVGLCLSAAGAEVEIVNLKPTTWRDECEGVIVPALANLVRESEPHLDTSVISQLNAENFRTAARYQVIEAQPEQWSELVPSDCDTLLCDGIGWLIENPQIGFQHLHALCITGAMIQLVIGPDEPCSVQDVEMLRRVALKEGFGISSCRSAVNEPDRGEVGARGIGLIQLSAPMHEFPLGDTESSQIMAHCNARYDIACKLVKGADVLDAGGATGIGGRRMMAAGANSVTSLDGAAEAIQIGKKKRCKGLRFVHWDLDTSPLPFNDESFDVVTCIEVLEHMIEQSTLINEFLRVLRPGGLLLVTVPDRDFEANWDRLNGFDNPFHHHVPSRDQLVSYLDGFNKIRWFRQFDAVGSIVIEEKENASPSGEFDCEGDYNPNSGPYQVLAALCTKRGSGASRKHPRHLISKLRIWENHSAILTHHAQHQRGLERLNLEQRFRWWSECNRMMVDRDGLEQRARLAEEAVAGSISEGNGARSRSAQLELELVSIRAELSESKSEFRDNLKRAALAETLEHDLQTTRNELATFQPELKKQSERATRAVTRLEEREFALSEIRDELKVTRDLLEARIEKSACLAQTQKDLIVAREEIESIRLQSQAQLEKHEATITDAHAASESARACDQERLETHRCEARKRIDVKDREISDSREELRLVREELAKALERSDAESVRKQCKIEEGDSNLKSAKVEIKKLEKILSHTEERRVAAASQLANARLDLRSAKTSNEKLSTEIHTIRSDRERLVVDLERFRTMCAEEQRSNIKLRAQLSEVSRVGKNTELEAREKLRETIQGEMERVERRCLEMESRVYDLEDQPQLPGDAA